MAGLLGGAGSAGQDVKARKLYIGNLPLDLLFLDCHDVPASTALLTTLLRQALLGPSAFVSRVALSARR